MMAERGAVWPRRKIDQAAALRRLESGVGYRVRECPDRGNLNLLELIENMEIWMQRAFGFSARDNAVDAAFRMAFGEIDLPRTEQLAAAENIEGYKTPYQMNHDRTHPLGDEETDQINPGVLEGLTPGQLEWLCGQSDFLGRKKLQILRQALFEWIGEHLEYRFNEARFGDTVRQALEEFMNRHSADVLMADNPPQSGAAKVSE